MNWANWITLFRISLAPFFLFLFTWYQQTPSLILVSAVVLVFLVSEFSDLLDGWVARHWKLGSDLGKLLDTFADIVSRLTIFLCLLMVDILSLVVFAVVFYRELAMLFLRLLMVRLDHVQEAKIGGKMKAWAYFLSSGVGLAYYCLDTMFNEIFDLTILWWSAQILFWLSAFLALWSFFGYFMIYYNLRKAKEVLPDPS